MEKEYPKYTRKENRTCKLTDEQIGAIKPRRLAGETYGAIARDYGVTPEAIYYWCLSEEKKKENNKRQYEINKNRYSLHNKEQKDKGYFIEYRKRKKELHPELKEYENQFTQAIKKATRPNYKECVKKHCHKYWEKYKDKLKEKNKKYQLVHLDKFKEYNRKFRKDHPDRVKELAKKSYSKYKEKRLAHNRKMYRMKHPIIKRITKYGNN